jgi:8-oxo-dGTP pyrophosphatase MutT (NUDIX family)
VTTPILRFHAIGDWEPALVRSAWVPSSHELPPEAADAVEQAWSNAKSRPGVNLFDGPMCRLESWQLQDGRLELAMSRTSYKLFWGTNISNPQLADQYGPQLLANPVGVSTLLETADGHLLLGRRNASVAYYPNRIHPFAGSLEPEDTEPTAATNGPSPFAAVRRELAEELGLTDQEISQVSCTGIAEDLKLRQPELIFRAKTSLTRLAVESQVDRNEHVDGIAIPAERLAIETAIGDASFTPVAVASLLLWGRIEYGEGWFGSMGL